MIVMLGCTLPKNEDVMLEIARDGKISYVPIDETFYSDSLKEIYKKDWGVTRYSYGPKEGEIVDEKFNFIIAVPFKSSDDLMDWQEQSHTQTLESDITDCRGDILDIASDYYVKSEGETNHYVLYLEGSNWERYNLFNYKGELCYRINTFDDTVLQNKIKSNTVTFDTEEFRDILRDLSIDHESLHDDENETLDESEVQSDNAKTEEEINLNFATNFTIEKNTKIYPVYQNESELVSDPFFRGALVSEDTNNRYTTQEREGEEVDITKFNFLFALPLKSNEDLVFMKEHAIFHALSVTYKDCDSSEIITFSSPTPLYKDAQGDGYHLYSHSAYWEAAGLFNYKGKLCMNIESVVQESDGSYSPFISNHIVIDSKEYRDVLRELSIDHEAL
jgi:hypothetical protein